MPSPSRIVEAAGGVRRARPLLGTLVEIQGWADWPLPVLHAAVDRAFAAVESIHRLMSYHDAGSDVARLNRDAARVPHAVARETYEVLEAALRMAAVSGGAFDPCVGGVLETWGYLPRIDAREPDAAANWRDIELLSGRRVRFGRPLRVDLGGIAKGYAVDAAVHVLRDAGVPAVIVNAGGDLRIAGDFAQCVRVRNPRAPSASTHVLEVRNSAVATSAAYFSRGPDGSRSALVDPKTRGAWVGEGSVTVCARDCMTADALTKVVLFAPAAAAQRALALCGAAAFTAE